MVLAAAITGGILLATQASGSNSTLENSTTTTDLTQVSDATNSNSTMLITGDAPGLFCPGYGMGFGGHGMGFGRHGMGGFGQIQVSDEYKTAVTTVAENDTDVQQLLSNGYNVTKVMPIIKTTIDAQGNVVTKATNATLAPVKDTTGVAFVSVDLQQSKVTQIVTYTRTVIEK